MKHIIATQPPRFIALDNKQKIFTTSFKKLHKSFQIIFICKIKLHNRNRIKRWITRIYILLFIIMNIHEFKYAFLAGKMSFPLYGCTDVWWTDPYVFTADGRNTTMEADLRSLCWLYWLYIDYVSDNVRPAGLYRKINIEYSPWMGLFYDNDLLTEHYPVYYTRLHEILNFLLSQCKLKL